MPSSIPTAVVAELRRHAAARRLDLTQMPEQLTETWVAAVELRAAPLCVDDDQRVRELALATRRLLIAFRHREELRG